MFWQFISDLRYVLLSDIIELENALLRMRKTKDLGELTAASLLLGKPA